MKIPGAFWIIALTVVNSLPLALADAFPGAVWVPLAVDLLLVVAKAIQVYAPKPSVAPQASFSTSTFVPAHQAAHTATTGKVRTFLLG
jgi:hypothetical protein